ELLSVFDDGRVLLVPCASDGVPATVARESLRARTYRRDAEPRPGAGDVVANTRAASPTRWVVVDAAKSESVCVRPASAATATCRDVPRTGLVRLRPAH